MTTPEALLVIGGCGLVGGAGKALVGSADVVLPCAGDDGRGGRLWYPGVVGTLVAGVLAAALSWLLYGPLAGATILGGTDRSGDVGLSAAEIAGAVLVGFAGAQWLNAEAGKRLAAKDAETAKDAATICATKPPDPDAAAKLAAAKPADTLGIAAGIGA